MVGSTSPTPATVVSATPATTMTSKYVRTDFVVDPDAHRAKTQANPAPPKIVAIPAAAALPFLP